MLHALRDRARRHGEDPALWSKRNGAWRATTWRQYAERVRQTGFGFESLGVREGTSVAILGFNREEWLLSLLGAMGLGATAVGLYTTSSPEQLAYVLGHCEAELVVVENAAYAEKLSALRDELPRLRCVVLMEGTPTREGELSFADLLERGERHAGRGAERAWNEKLDAIHPSATAALIYTSGTTGEPKGVMLSHHNLCWTAARLVQAAEVEADDVLVSYLPLSHIAEQTCSIYGPLLTGMQVHFAESLETVADAIREVRPTVFFGVPRVWEKFKAKAEEGIRAQSPRRQKLVSWARKLSLERTGRELRHEWTSVAMEAQHLVASRLVFNRLREKIGFDRTRLFATSAAPIGRDVLDFFASTDIVLREVYGMTETTGPVTFNTPENTKLGSVGRPMLGVELRIADDGEVLVRGGNVCQGYFKDPRATEELLTDGWLHTGDVGELDSEGFLRITGRKKELLVTSGGKKTAPAPIEALLKDLEPVGNAMVVGDGRNHLAALLPLDAEKAVTFARARGLPEDPQRLAVHPELRRHLEEQIAQRVNPRLSRFEHVRRFEILPHDFTPERGELTPTLKLRRAEVERRYRAQIDGLYEG